MFNRNTPNNNDVASLVTEFEEIEFLSEGGQKFVYTGTIEDEKFAIKLIPLYEEYGEDVKNTILKRAQRELTIMERIDSPFFIKKGPTEAKIITLDGHDYFCYSEIFINGQDLQEVIKTRHFTLEEAIQLGLQISSVIEGFWVHQYIHRDIKPNNILLKDDGNFLLLDAGVAFDLNDVSLTRGHEQPGTKIYMSPEQLAQTGREIDFRSDLFSLGVVLYEVLTQRHPFVDFSRNATQNIASILNSNARSIVNFRAEIPRSLDRLITTRLLAKRPHLRFRKCELLLQELNKIREEI
ncbi:serine/threonine protein kinase [Bacillus infantis]|uniref:serine/threonine protein kinase n=1 Tax=Bacillus infantis TaxID=324767 RepID=UPI0020052D3C|nr:serine/threonine-protein kinase [Bacillus infantis]MCK6206330.1 serine/threonine protein kinase [Bacillus infantis]